MALRCELLACGCFTLRGYAIDKLRGHFQHLVYTYSSVVAFAATSFTADSAARGAQAPHKTLGYDQTHCRGPQASAEVAYPAAWSVRRLHRLRAAKSAPGAQSGLRSRPSAPSAGRAFRRPLLHPGPGAAWLATHYEMSDPEPL